MGEQQPFAPVPLGDALQARIANASRDNWGGARAQELLGQLDAQSRRRPAFMRLTETGKNEIVATPGPDTTAILQVNLNYYDKSLPRYVPQVLAVDVHLIDLVPPIDEPTLRRRLARQMLEATDWQRMADELMH
jgi:hypothetical protein